MINIEFLEDIEDDRMREVEVTHFKHTFYYSTKTHDAFIRAIKRRLPDHVKSENNHLITVKVVRILEKSLFEK